MNIIDFISACDSSLNAPENPKTGHSNEYERIYQDALQFVHDANDVLKVIAHLRQKLYILHHQSGLNHEKYLPVLDCIREVARKKIRSDSTETGQSDWNNLIKSLIENRSMLHLFNFPRHPHLDTELHSFSNAYLRLAKLGVEFDETNHSICISEDSHSLVNDQIDSICRKLGGEELAARTAEMLGNTYNHITGRFTEYRHISITTETKVAMPFGYLVAIASKYAGIRGNGDPNLFPRLLILISDIIVIYEIQPYNQFESSNIGRDDLIPFIQKNILYDTFVGIAQTKASYATALIGFVNTQLTSNRYASHGVKLTDLARVALAIISISQTKRFITATIKEISKKARISEQKTSIAMDQLLSVKAGNVNSELKFPPTNLDIDHHFKPAIKLPNGYKIFPKSIAALGCINTVLTSISHPDGIWKNASDSHLGYVIECFLRDAFAARGIQSIYGESINTNPQLEADLICETKESIYIFEMKKKGLTRQAQSGDEVKILADLADSVLASHVQAMKIEKTLRQSNSLTLIREEKESQITLDNRNIYRISVSLSDFGALQDKIVLQRLLTIASQTTISTQNESDGKKLKKWVELSKTLHELAKANEELEESAHPFHNSLFMSIPQIITMLDNSEDKEDFLKFVKTFVSVSTGSRNTYTEITNWLDLQKRWKAEGIAAPSI